MADTTNALSHSDPATMLDHALQGSTPEPPGLVDFLNGLAWAQTHPFAALQNTTFEQMHASTSTDGPTVDFAYTVTIQTPFGAISEQVVLKGDLTHIDHAAFTASIANEHGVGQATAYADDVHVMGHMTGDISPDPVHAPGVGLATHGNVGVSAASADANGHVDISSSETGFHAMIEVAPEVFGGFQKSAGWTNDLPHDPSHHSDHAMTNPIELLDQSLSAPPSGSNASATHEPPHFPDQLSTMSHNLGGNAGQPEPGLFDHFLAVAWIQANPQEALQHLTIDQLRGDVQFGYDRPAVDISVSGTVHTPVGDYSQHGSIVADDLTHVDHAVFSSTVTTDSGINQMTARADNLHVDWHMGSDISNDPVHELGVGASAGGSLSGSFATSDGSGQTQVSSIGITAHGDIGVAPSESGGSYATGDVAILGGPLAEQPDPDGNESVALGKQSDSHVDHSLAHSTNDHAFGSDMSNPVDLLDQMLHGQPMPSDPTQVHDTFHQPDSPTDIFHGQHTQPEPAPAHDAIHAPDLMNDMFHGHTAAPDSGAVQGGPQPENLMEQMFHAPVIDGSHQSNQSAEPHAWDVFAAQVPSHDHSSFAPVTAIDHGHAVLDPMAASLQPSAFTFDSLSSSHHQAAATHDVWHPHAAAIPAKSIETHHIATHNLSATKEAFSSLNDHGHHHTPDFSAPSHVSTSSFSSHSQHHSSSDSIASHSTSHSAGSHGGSSHDSGGGHDSGSHGGSI